MNIRKINGIAGVKKRNSTQGEVMGVRVIEGMTGVELVLGACDVFAELTPEQAEYLSSCLAEAALNVRARQGSK